MSLNLRNFSRLSVLLLSLPPFICAETITIDQQQDAPAFTILDTQEVDLGTHSIIYNRVVAPKLKSQSEVQEQVTQQSSPVPQEMVQQEQAKRYASLFLWATVYEGDASEVHFWQDGNEYVIWSNINFNYLRTLFNFESEDSIYSLMVAADDSSHSKAEAWSELLKQQKVPGAVNLPASLKSANEGSEPSYVLISAPQNPPTAEFLQAMEDLHYHYGLHSQELIQAYQESEAHRIAQEQWLKDHPQKKDTVINYFPIKSVYTPSNAANQ